MHRSSFWNTASLFLALATFSPHLQASAVTVPAGLSPGENYRIIFGTSTLTMAFWWEVGYYNTFVTNAAHLDSGLASLNTTWALLGSTYLVNVFDNAGLSANDTTTKFFNTRGELITIGVNGLYGGSFTLHSNIIFTEAGNDVMDDAGNRMVWTGTWADGTTSIGLGTQNPMFGYAHGGVSTWTAGSYLSPYAPLPVYGISGVLSASEVPEPSTLTMASLTIAVLTIAVLTRAALRRRASHQAMKHP